MTVDWPAVSDWMGTSSTDAGLVVLSGLGGLIAAIAAIRLVGLRSLSKMSSFDFAVTIALGSILGSVAASSTSLANGALAIFTLLGVQYVIAKCRRAGWGDRIVDNRPLLLMEGSRVIEQNMMKARVTGDDLRAKLREANVTDMDQVLAVVFETTGDISVLHGPGPLDESLLDGVGDDQRPRAGILPQG